MRLGRGRLLALAAAAALMLAACGDDGGSQGSASGGGEDLAIDSPSDGAIVQQPFTLKFSSRFELGPTDQGVHHVHVFYDGNDTEYKVVEADNFEVSGLSPGEHTIHASLRNADHSAAGAETEIKVTVEGGAGDGTTDTTGGGYDY